MSHLAIGDGRVLLVGMEAMEAIEGQSRTCLHLEAYSTDALQTLKIGEHGVTTQPLPARIVPGGITHLAGTSGTPLHVAIEQGDAHGGGGIDAEAAAEGAGEAARHVGGTAFARRRQRFTPWVGRLGLKPRPWGMGHGQQEQDSCAIRDRLSRAVLKSNQASGFR